MTGRAYGERMRYTLRWTALALLGLVAAAAIAVAASQLARQPIGLNSQPLSAGRGLAPAPAPRHRAAHRPKRPPAPAPATRQVPSPGGDDGHGASGDD